MGDFDWDIWWKKLGKNLALVLGSTALIYIAEYLTAYPLPEEFAFWGGLFTIACLQIGNYIKHNLLNK